MTKEVLPGLGSGALRDEIECALRNASGEAFGNSVVTAGGWPETKQRMELIAAFVKSATENVLTALSLSSPIEPP